MPEHTPELAHDVLLNGLDFLLTAFEQLENATEPRDHKYAVVNLAAGVELILKARLVREHWSLVFRDPGSADWRNFHAGDFQSAGPKEVRDRLQRVCGLTFSDAEKVSLETIAKSRNRLVHFHASLGVEALRAQAVGALGVVFDLVGREFPTDGLPEPLQVGIELLRSAVAQFEEFAEARMREIAPALEALRRELIPVLQCSDCLKPAFELSYEARCHFCGFANDDAVELASAYVENCLRMSMYEAAKDGDGGPIYFCDKCDLEAFVFAPYEMTEAICFGCVTTYPHDSVFQCLRCTNWFGSVDVDPPSICDSCIEDVMRS